LCDHAILDDHQPFLDRGIPAIVLIDFQYGSAPGLNDYWHTSQDTLDKLSADSFEVVGQVVLRVLNDLSTQSTSLPFRADN
jgi:Zn-dependent M28 family amino/carboxypeptidase